MSYTKLVNELLFYKDQVDYHLLLASFFVDERGDRYSTAAVQIYKIYCDYVDQVKQLQQQPI